MNATKIEALLVETYDANPARRRKAIADLCPCHVRADREAVWGRLFELADDPDLGVRRLVFHSMIDGSPRSREREIVQAVERLREDESPKLRRQARKLLANYHRTGRVNIAGE